MKKKIFGFCLVFMMLSTALAFSQSKIVNRQKMTCIEAIDNLNGISFQNRIGDVYLNEYDDNTFQISLYYRDGSPTEYMYFKNGRSLSSGRTYDASITTSEGQHFFNFTSNVSASGNYLNVYLYQSGRLCASMTFR